VENAETVKKISSLNIVLSEGLIGHKVMQGNSIKHHYHVIIFRLEWHWKSWICLI